MAHREGFDESQSDVARATVLANEGCSDNGGPSTLQETIQFHDDCPESRDSRSSVARRRRRACTTCQRLCSDRLLIAAVVTIVILWALIVGFIALYVIGPAPESDEGLTTSNSSAENTCQRELYSGSICRSTLGTMSQICGIHDSETANSGVYISTQGLAQVDTETQVLTLYNGLQFLNPSPECEEAVLPFLCLFAFPLCDGSGQLYQPSFGECETLTQDTCGLEWATALSFLGSENLPQCGSLPETSLECSGNSTINDSNSATNDSNSTELVCSRDFYPDTDNTCKADCGKWKLYASNKLENAMLTLIILATVIGLIGGAVVLILSCINYKKAFAFPSAFVRYEVAIVMVYNVVILISAIGGGRLFCSSRSVFASSKESTPYCTFTAVIFYNVYLQISTLWILHVVAIFWGLMFPFHAHRFDVTGKNKYLHLIAIILAVVIPAITTAVSLGPEGVEFQRFPPLICTADSRNANFYASLLPVALYDAVGFSLLIIIFWIIHKNSRIADAAIRHNRTPEVKILFILCYFLGIGLFSIAIFSASFWNTVPKFRQNLSKYFLCETIGTIGNSCTDERSALDDAIVIQLLFDVAYILLGLFPAVNLIYAVNISDLKQKCRKYFPAWYARSQEMKFDFTTQTVL